MSQTSIGLTVDSNGFTVCDKCGSKVNVGSAPKHNLSVHQNGAKCKLQAAKQEDSTKLEARRQQFAGFFSKPQTALKLVPPTVQQPPPIHSTSIHSLSKATTVTPCPPRLLNAKSPTVKPSSNVKCLQHLGDLIEKLPLTIPEATPTHPFAQFSGNLEGIVPQGEDAWEIWDGPLNTILQQGPDELDKLVARGDHGVAAFLHFLEHLVNVCCVDSVLFENKVERLILAIQRALPLQDDPQPLNPPFTELSCLPPTTVIVSDDEAIEILEQPTSKAIPTSTTGFASHSALQCAGLQIKLSASQSPHTVYPFALHDSYGDPWDYAVHTGRLILHARDCTKTSRAHDEKCGPCALLAKNSKLMGILDRVEKGVNENCPFHYHGAGGMMKILRQKTTQIQALKLTQLNDARKLTRKVTAIDNYKEWIMAVGSGKVQRIDRLVIVALNNKRGIQGLLDLYHRAARNVYKPKAYTEEDKLKAIFFWRVGGQRVADMAHRSLELPSLRTSRRNSSLPRLHASAGYPTVDDIKKNVVACLEPVSSILALEASVAHQILMVDEMKVEERPRWDEHTNTILGICREHATPGSLTYTDNREVDLLFRKVRKNLVHLASNATVGAIGILSKHNRLYGALPILISGQCGRETGQQHAGLLETLLDGAKRSTLRTICISSDGESRRGESLVRLTMKRQLASTSPIYPHLIHLRFMNLEVGNDDITADKDYKHVFKRCRNLCLRARGVRLHDVEILPSVLRSHFIDHNISQRHIDNILKPDDKQDVKLAYDLLSEVWKLPPLLDEQRPGFLNARDALQTLGGFFQHLLLPYICVDLSLSEQLIHLSAAAHMLLAMAREERLGSLAFLMPSQLYIDIMIMIKNAFFCVAKVKVDTGDDGEFYLILLGTDRLEEDFGGVRTMVGNDSGVDVLQLALRLAGATEVMGILAQHPEWDRSPRRLKLPALSKDGLDIHKHVDHIKPTSWRGDVSVRRVNLATCWEVGRQEVKKFPKLDTILSQIEVNDSKSVNLFQPLGADIIRNKPGTDDYDDTAENYGSTTNGQNSATSLEPLDTATEEAAVEEAASHSHSPCFELDGQTIWKGRYLNERFKEIRNPGSRDRLKRYANVSRYAIRQDPMQTDYVVRDEVDLPSIRMDYPVASILKCSDRLFVCVGEVNDLVHNATHVGQLAIDDLSDPTVFVSFQLLYLIPASEDYDPSCKNDWRWSWQRGSTYRLPGRLIEPVNPEVSTKEAQKPCYLFESGSLQVVGSLFLERLSREDGIHIPTITASPLFPYREANGKACFVCEDSKKEEELLGMKQCPYCKIDLPSAAQRVLEHMAAHVLHDDRVPATTEPCGLCLRLSPVCEFYLRKGRGSSGKPKIDYENSKCANLIHFRYATAMSSGPSNPCTNVPVSCQFCREGSAAIWRYNMKEHLKTKHPHVSLHQHTTLWKIANTESSEMHRIWKERKVIKKTRMSSKKKTDIEISEAHSSRLGLCVFAGDDSDDSVDAPGDTNQEDGTDKERGIESDQSDDEAEADVEGARGVMSQALNDVEYSADCMPAGASTVDGADSEPTILNHLEKPMLIETDDAEPSTVARSVDIVGSTHATDEEPEEPLPST